MYKYLKAEHAQLMVRNGQIRITTLHECRAWDNPELGDPNEGKGILRQIIRDKEFTSENPMPGPLGSMINARNIKVGQISGSWEIDMPDVYMYCATLEASRKVMQELDMILACGSYSLGDSSSACLSNWYAGN